jgi:hypothetical protein
VKRDVAHVLSGVIARTVIDSRLHEEQVMPPESRAESELSIPKDLLSEVQNQLPAGRGNFQVEGWKPSLMSKMFGFLDRRSRE